MHRLNKNLFVWRAILLLWLLVASAVAVSESTRVYELPQGSRPHDVAPAPDGKVWYTGQRRGVLGILEPQTGAVREVPLGQGSAPHGVIAGPDGAAWITDGGLNAIVRVDPVTEAVTVFPLPPQRPQTNLNTAAFDGDGQLWFTGQSGIYGRLDPASGAMQVYDAPRGRGPYGIAATPDGEIYYCSLAGSYIARIEHSTGDTTLIEPPRAGQGARRVWPDSVGRIWVAEWNSGFLSRFDPGGDSGNGRWSSWRLPGAAPRAYAVYVDERDIIWVSDFGANAVLSFDPKTETFTAYPGSGPGAMVRQILGRPGEVWLPESGLDRLVLIRTD
uniref:Vgb family protein n=1 Tax=Marinobacterium profundum TaxID=1714300 RepID=UPI00083184AD|nr:lyase [Marinobacterium profundum]